MNDTKIKDLSKLFTQRGYNVVIGTTYIKIQEWLSYYRGDVNNVHHFTKKIMNGNTIDIHLPSLQMPKKVAEEWSSLIVGENVELKAGAQQKELDDVLEDNHFLDELSQFVELVHGVYGTGVIVEYVSNDKIKLNFIYGDKIMVLDYDNSTIKGIAVIDEFEEDEKSYTHVMYHTVVDDKYRIEHEIYENKSGNKGLGKPAPIEILFTDEEIAAMYHPIYNEEGEIVGAEYWLEYDSKPHFQIYKPANVNNHDVKSPMGMPSTANALSSFANIDRKSFNLDREDGLTRTRIFVDDKATQVSRTKNVDTGEVEHTKYFDEQEDVYQVLKDMVGDGSNKAIETSNPTYNSEPRIQAIKLDLSFCGFRTGLGTDYFSFENGAVYVNEANVISSNSDTWRNRQKHVKRLREALIGMIKAILFLKEIEYNDKSIDAVFSDSIITDDSTELEKLRIDAQDEIIPMYMYVMKAYNLTKPQAIKLIEEADTYTENDEPVVKPKDDDDSSDEDQDDDDIDAEE